LRDLPLEDYSEQDLHEWLDSFGRADRVKFLKDPVTKELTGRGYVRFQSHEEAVGFIAAFPVDDAEGNVQGTWSLSERLTRHHNDVLSLVGPRLRSIATATGCGALVFAGGGRCTPGPQAPASLVACGTEAGPLHFAAWPRQRLKADPSSLQKQVAELLGDVVANAGKGGPRTASVASSAVSSAACGARMAEDGIGDARPMAGIQCDTSNAPYIVVRNFPDSWREQQVRLVFALYGGVAKVHFAAGIDGKRVAHVELKNPENMSKAVEQLHNTQVGDGDLIEECTVSCELAGGADGTGGVAARQRGPMRRAIFIDELPMSKRPEVPPSKEDREIFLSSLPVKDCSEDQIQSWLEGFGEVDDVCLFRDNRTGEMTGRGYVRFRTHEEANACVEAQATSTGVEDGDIMAAWSESERASRRANSVYGVDPHIAFAGPSGRVLASILVAAKMKAQDLWMFSDMHPPRDRSSPKPEGKQLHFVAICDDERFEELRSVLAGALQTFHEKISKRLKESKDARDAKDIKDREREARGKEAREQEEGQQSTQQQRQQQQQQHQQQQPPGWHRPPSEGWSGYPPSAPPGAPPGGWYDWQRPPPREHPYARPPPGWGYPAAGPRGPYPGGPPPADWRWPRGPPQQPPPGWGSSYPPGFPPDQGHPPRPPPTSSTPDQPHASATSPAGHRQPRDRDRDRERRRRGDGGGGDAVEKAEGDITGDPVLESRIVKGEQLVADGKAASQSGSTAKAYEKYCRGLQYLLDVMPKLSEDKPKAQALRQRINGYLDEAERLKQELDSGRGGSDGSGNHATAGEAEASRSHASGGSVTGQAEAIADSALRGQVQKGESLIEQGQRLESSGQLDEAYEKYCRGLQYLLEVMPKLGEDNPDVSAVRGKIGGYLEQAERLKERLEAREGGGGPGTEPVGPGRCGGSRDRSRSRDGGDGSVAGDTGDGGSRHHRRRRHTGGGSHAGPGRRSRSPGGRHHGSCGHGHRREPESNSHRRERSGGRGRGRGDEHRRGGGGGERSRSRSRERRRTKADSAKPSARGADRDASREGRAQPPSYASPDRGGGRVVPATRTKAPPPSGPPSSAPLLRPKSGAPKPTWSKPSGR